ncbi:hypothetical protein [Legionella bozemanae]|uniref:hypothetical protein n=1 Tax=Legionella bozemanae TaxID=447 RepID=UPI00399CEF7F
MLNPPTDSLVRSDYFDNQTFLKWVYYHLLALCFRFQWLHKENNQTFVFHRFVHVENNGFNYIEKQDFFMQYPHLLQKYLEREKISNPEKVSESIMNKMLEEKINSLERIIKEKEQKVEMLKEQLNNSNQKEFKMLDAINSHARLLEYKEIPPLLTA